MPQIKRTTFQRAERKDGCPCVKKRKSFDDFYNES